MVSRIEQRCIERGLKMTEQRRVIARVLSDAEDHPDVEEVYRRAAEIDPRISLATVYRTVRLFEEANILERHDFGDGRARYEEAPETHHDHLIDVQSGQVIEFQQRGHREAAAPRRGAARLQAGRPSAGALRRADRGGKKPARPEQAMSGLPWQFEPDQAGRHHASASLEVRLAETAAEIDAAQALRYRVFYEEMDGAADAGDGGAAARLRQLRSLSATTCW